MCKSICTRLIFPVSFGQRHSISLNFISLLLFLIIIDNRYSISFGNQYMSASALIAKFYQLSDQIQFIQLKHNYQLIIQIGMQLSKTLRLEDSKMQEILRAWKSKSLNSKSMEYYKIPLQNSKQQERIGSKKTTKQDHAPQEQKNQMLPQPKIIKINESIFCIYLNSKLIVYKLKNAGQKEVFVTKLEQSFYPYPMSFKNNIKFVNGNNSEFIFVGFQNELHILNIKYNEDKNQNGKIRKIFSKVETVQVKHIPKLKGVTFIKQLNNEIEEQILVVVSSQKIIKYPLLKMEKSMQELKIVFSEKDAEYNKLFKEINTINILCENNIYIYLFGTKEGISAQQQANDKGGKKQKKCQFLYLVKFNIDSPEKDTIQPIPNVIDHVFEVGIFSKSKIFQCGPSAFLISLYEEIIVVKYHFQKFFVWDNISLASSKSIQKKGQLILADKIVMVYTEMGQIFAHNIFFSESESKLKYPRIDNFKGNDNDEQILYDAIVLEYEPGSFMKVLYYFKESDVYTPSHKFVVHKQDKMIADPPKELQIAIRCIQQNDPLLKLAELFKSKKTPQQISEFVQRFNIDQLNRSKCQWSVSEKNEKDIQNLLLEIKQNEYIQNQLTQILKSNPHDLRFLSKIEKKQIQRYKKMLATKILKNDQDKDIDKLTELVQQTGSFFTRAQVQQIKQIIKWVMESIMFEKKLAYSKNFLEFMEYQFIDIGKLKAASLKEEIKLLSCKGYEKRLQYFLNSFKYMILANFENIFQFLIEDKTVPEIQKFFKQNFPFILPKFQESSEIFRKKNFFNNEKYIRQRKASFAPQNALTDLFKKQQVQKQEDKCQLWEDKFHEQAEKRKIETKQSFRKQINDEIEAAINVYNSNSKQQKRNTSALKQCLKKEDAQSQFKKILDQFTKQTWFLQNKSKLHSIIEGNIEELQQKMIYLKRIGVFHLLIKFFYQKIGQKKYRQQDVDATLQNFKRANLIPESFEQNILIRREVYNRISQNKKMIVGLPLLQDFLIYGETKYFNYLFSYYRGMLLKEIKVLYEKVGEGFFKQKFQRYLNSDMIELPAVIDFLDEFEGNSNDDIRMDVFTCIKKMLKVSDKQNTASFVNKLMQKQILKNQGRGHSGIDSLIDQAKITFGFYFYEFFNAFQIEETYKQLIEETMISQYESCHIIKKILELYTKSYCFCDEKYEQTNEIIKFQQKFGLQQFQITIKAQPLQFFGIILYLLDTLRFEIKPETVFDKFIELLLESKNYDDIAYFIDQFRRGIGGEIDEQENEHFDEQQQEFKSKNYQLLRQFYEVDGINVKDRLISNILIYNRKLLKDLSNINQKLFNLPRSYRMNKIQPTLFVVSDSFQKVLDELGLVNAEVNREKAFLDMLKNIKQIEPLLVINVLKMRFQNFNGNYLQENSVLLNDLSSFMFMIRLLQAIPSSKFNQLNEKQIKYEYWMLKKKEQLNAELISSRSQQSVQIKHPSEQQQQFEDAKPMIIQQLYLMECIYEQFQSASKYNSNNQNKEEEKVGLTRFLMELAMRLIKEKNFFYSQQVILRIIRKQYYFRDVFYQFMASIKHNSAKSIQKEFVAFIKEFIQASHERLLTNLFNTFITQNEIKSFEGPTNFIEVLKEEKEIQPLKKQSKTKRRKSTVIQNSKAIVLLEKVLTAKFGNSAEQNDQSPALAKIIFSQLLLYNRHDQAYYFLVRNQLLSVTEAMNENYENNQNNESYALISIYLKCLKMYLCDQFYPTFDFYRSKHEALVNQFERRDIIKDINIAISRLKEMVLQQRLKVGQEQNSLQASEYLMSCVAKKLLPTEQISQNTQNDEDKLDEKEKKDLELENMKNQMKVLEDHLSQLVQLYKKYMASISENPVIKLNVEENKKRKKKSENMDRQITPDQINVISQSNKKMNQNIKVSSQGFSAQQLNQKHLPSHEDELQIQKTKIRQEPKIKQMERQINIQIKEAKLLSEKYQKPYEKEQQAEEKQSKNIKAYNDLKQREKSDLQSVKQSYKSPTADRVNSFLEEFRLRKSKINEKSEAKSKFSGVSVASSEDPRQNMIMNQLQSMKKLISPPHLLNIKNEGSMSGDNSGGINSQLRVSRNYEVKLLDVEGNIKNIYMPVTMNKDQKGINSRVSSFNTKQSNLDQKHSNLRSDLQIHKNTNNFARSQVKNQSSLQELAKLFSEREPQCSKYIQKLQIVKNNLQVGLQLTKNIYSTINSFEVFIKYISFLLQHYPKYKEVIEEKAHKIGQQAMGIEYKINLKELFPIQMFTNTVNVSIKQYYKTAYELMRPNLMKILARPQTNVHGIAILYRFGFGSQNLYYYRVYEDYIRILLKDYNENTYEEKKLFLLGQKLRTLYNNINTQNRQSKFEQLIREVNNEGKRKNLCKQILKILERRGEMLTGEKQTDLKDVLIKLC